MKIDKDTLHKLAHLARLELDPANEKEMLNSLSEILTWVEKLNELDTKEVEPLVSMSYELNSFREDKVTEELPREAGLVNAPAHDDKFFIVPKVIE